MKKIQKFTHSMFGEIRTMKTDNGEIWFVGKDVAKVLGYANPSKAVRVHVQEKDKLMSKMDTSFGAKDTYLINESGLYALILSSKLIRPSDTEREMCVLQVLSAGTCWQRSQAD